MALYKQALEEKEKLKEQAELVKEQREEKELAECTFQPKIYSKEDDLDKMKDESFYEGVPKGFKVFIYYYFMPKYNFLGK